MAPRNKIQLITVRDFTGGINLQRNLMQLAQNESPDLMNVDVSERGGFRLRRGVQPWGSATAAEPKSLHAFYPTTGGAQVVTCDGTNAKYGTGAGWTTIAARTGVNRSVQFKGKLYLQNGVDAAWSWDGATKANLGQTYNGNLQSPNGGDMPIGKVMAVYRGCVFVANTLEGGTAHPSRIRWSHPNQPEDWVDYHWIDVDVGQDGDEITALVPFDDRLLIFKRHSVHVLFGEPPEALSVYPLSADVGAISQEATVATDHGVYFCDWPGGVFRFSGKSIEWVFGALYPAIKDGDITAAAAAQIQLGFGNRRLWLSVPWGGVSTRSRVFVLSPQLNKGGSWVQYDLPVGPFLTLKPPGGGEQRFLAAHVGGTQLLQLETKQSTDNFGEGGKLIVSWYATPWFDLGEPAIRKKWKRPEVVLVDGQDSQILCKVFRDYDPSYPKRSFRFVTHASSSEVLVWDEGHWDGKKWASNEDEKWKVDKGSPVGSGRAVMLRFEGPLEPVDWGVNALTMKVIARPVRS